MTSDQVPANHPQQQRYDWSNIATVRRSISRNRSNAGDRYPRYGDLIRSGQQKTVLGTPYRAGSIEMGIHTNTNGMLYPHLEERPMSHNLRTAKSEYFLAPRQSHYQRPTTAYLGSHPHHPHNIDDDTKWITSSSSTASYHSGLSGCSSTREEEEEIDDDRAHLYAEIGKPVSVVSLPPLDRGCAPYRRFATTGRVAINASASGGGDAGVRYSPIYQQQTNSVGDNNAHSTNDLNLAVRSAQTPPPPAMTSSSHHHHMVALNDGQPQQQQQRKYFTLNPPRNQSLQSAQQRIDRSNQRRIIHHEDDLRRRSMTPMASSPMYNCYPGEDNTSGQLHEQQILNRSQSCYVDPLDYKVGCQNTLRSKPLIPWYELAIKDSNRRSCPQLEVDMIVNKWAESIILSLSLSLVIGINWGAINLICKLL